MSRSLRARWTKTAVLGGLAIAMAAVSTGDVVWGVVVPLVYGLGALWASPIGDRHTFRHDEIEALPVAERPLVVYARPGCTYCLRLRVALLGRSEPRWVDIWDDPEAAAYVRSINGGDETVPTVVVDGQPTTNPAPRDVLAAVRAIHA